MSTPIYMVVTKYHFFFAAVETRKLLSPSIFYAFFSLQLRNV